MTACRMAFGLASVSVAAAVHIGVPSAAAAELDDGKLVGTYEVIICHGPCSFSSVGNAVIEGNFVLLAKGIEPSEANRLDMFFERSLSRRDANGCYNLRRVSSQKYVGYANTRGPALTVWSLTNGELHLSLFRSTDAGYEAVLRENAGALSGTGQSWGAGVAEPQDKTMDHVIARRVGVAEIRTCGFEAKRYLQAG
jgi:hypothetical protein